MSYDCTAYFSMKSKCNSRDSRKNVFNSNLILSKVFSEFDGLEKTSNKVARVEFWEVLKK